MIPDRDQIRRDLIAAFSWRGRLKRLWASMRGKTEPGVSFAQFVHEGHRWHEAGAWLNQPIPPETRAAQQAVIARSGG